VKVIITGGGTAGHVYPGLAIAEEIKKLDPESNILFVGTKKGLESTVVPQAGHLFETINIRGFKRKISFDTLATFFIFFEACFKSIKILRSFRPDVVVGTGGYVSAPLVSTAILFRIPTIVHEQNSVPGLVNKVLGKWTDIVAVSFPASRKFFKRNCVITGNPVRKKILKSNQKESSNVFPVEPKRKNLLVFGGSQGSARINESLVEAYDKFRNFDNLQIIHVTGKMNFRKISNDIKSKEKPQDKLLYSCYAYLDNIDKAYEISDLVFCRAGATTIAEITARGIPSILVPYPYATGGHQEKNARILEQKGAARLILDKDLNGDTVFNLVSDLIFDNKVLADMKKNSFKFGKPEAAFELAKLIKGLAKEHRI